MSFEGQEHLTIKELLNQIPQFGKCKELFLETREKNRKFFPYSVGDDHMIVHVVDVDNCDIVRVSTVRTAPCQTLDALKDFLKEAVPLETKDVHLALTTHHKIKYLTDPAILHSGPWAKTETDHRIFVTPATPEAGDMANFEKSKFYKCIAELKDVVLLTLVLPDNLEEQCDLLLIPLLDDKNESSKDGGKVN
ncbi:unnamed protein product [Nesidiocoris tenuis]|uniref:Uncharacterized protein n=1 Tax=Nesidiocoris tenuis TaxID=355587 RepID=A0A6H5GRU2_9HEMI|nr:unnamed protein product [Nesidiocoris tenuis]CAB0006260.1 unnamed protein product [Nesidiocoris tenuis]